MAANDAFGSSGCPSGELLAGYCCGSLPPPLLEHVAGHLATCGTCLETMRGLHDSDDPLIANLRRYVPGQWPIEAVTASAPAHVAMSDSAQTRPETTVLEGVTLLGAKDDLGRPRTFGNYELLEVLGKGGMGVVYKARQTRSDLQVALKVIKSSVAAAPEARARFAVEVKAVARLRHPHVIRIHDCAEVDGEPYYSMELLEGGSLKDKLGGKQQPERAAAELVQTLALGVHATHQESIIHRDLKPGNVLLDSDGTLKISDFGLAKLMDADQGQTLTDAILGTPPYMAPEQARGDAGAIGPRTDVYALGVILYEMLTGRPPFLGENRMETLEKVRSEPPRPVTELRPGVNPDLEAVCLACLEKEPNKRYASAQDLADDLGRYLRDESTWARPLSWQTRMWRKVKRRPVLSIAAALVLIAVLGAAGVSAYLDPERQLGRIERRLAAGKEVALIDDNGPPLWYEWATADESQKAILKDGIFSVESWGVAMLDLVRDPQSTSYSFSTWIRHDEAIRTTGTVGIYFARKKRTLSDGMENIAYTLKFNGRDDERRLYPKVSGNYVGLWFEHEFAQSRIGSRCTAGRSLYLPLTYADRGMWRKLLIDVTPKEIRFTLWRDSQIWAESQSITVSLEDLESARNTVHDGLEFVGKLEPETIPDNSFRASLGLYVDQGSASFRNTVVQSRP